MRVRGRAGREREREREGLAVCVCVCEDVVFSVHGSQGAWVTHRVQLRYPLPQGT